MPSGPKRDRFHRLGVGDDGEDDLGLLGDRARRVGPEHALFLQKNGLVARPIPAGDFVSGLHQARHDQLPHGAQADKSEFHRETPAHKIALQYPRIRR